jgi:glycosyltransferase involved in cell wall biosynthesis
MTVYYDVAAIVHRHAGLGRYAHALLRALLEEHGESLALFYYGGPSDHPPDDLDGLPQQQVVAGRKPWRLRVWLAQLLRRRFNDLLPGASLYHATEHLLMPLPGIPTVLTVHDILYKRFPRYHKLQNYIYLNLAMPLFCRRADAIVAVSQATKRDLVRYWGVPEDKVTVVYEAAAPCFVPQSDEAIAAARARHNLPQRYLMTLCVIEPRKNHAGFLRAFEGLCRDDPDLYWVIGGSKGWLYEGFFAELEQSPVRDRVILPGYIEDAHLPGVYAGALAFVFPSLGEGFGLEPLEAMACGTPVLSSNATSLPEVGGDAAMYFDPRNVHEMAETTRRVLSDAGLRVEMRQRGLAQAAMFSWQRAARETWGVYQRLLAG